jgi:hypothetical protein
VCCGNAVTTSVITAIVDEMFDWRSCDKNWFGIFFFFIYFFLFCNHKVYILV